MARALLLGFLMLPLLDPGSGRAQLNPGALNPGLQQQQQLQQRQQLQLPEVQRTQPAPLIEIKAPPAADQQRQNNNNGSAINTINDDKPPEPGSQGQFGPKQPGRAPDRSR